MARAVAQAIETGEHLLVQAGTGTGKSLAYLVPAVRHAMRTAAPAVVSTATLALQAQIVDRDLPRLADALEAHQGRRPTFGIVKGRRNYLCAYKLAGGFPDEEEDALFDTGTVDPRLGTLGTEIVRLREWAETTDSGDRDELVPGVSERAWRQVSVSAHECLGGRCPVIAECFVERSRAAARDVDIVVTNHSFMAIDAFEDRAMLPEHDLLVIDEAHELVDRVTSTITDELSRGLVAAAARKAGRLTDAADALEEAGSLLGDLLDEAPEGRLAGIPEGLARALARVRDAARAVLSGLTPDQGESADGTRQVALAAVEEIHDTAARVLEERPLDVLWVNDEPRRGPVLRVAPMSVAALVRDKVFSDRTVVLTSATLELGGTFDALAGTIGLRGESAPAWRGLDVGSPFDYAAQGIAYVAAQLPVPGRGGTNPVVFDEIEALVRAAGGRTLGLFSSRRAAEAATEEMRRRFGDGDDDRDAPGQAGADGADAAAEGNPIGFLCQGEDQIGTLVRRFAREPRTCLFGTLSLWQGVDVPGSACQLVLIDRIPFPRPDDPLASARSEAIRQMGGNGFMAVSATHAALRLAQGAGRLIRSADDRGVVAFLDPRMVTARYAGFLQRSVPPFWPTTDRALVLGALRRLDENAPPVRPVPEPRPRHVAGAGGRARTRGVGVPTEGPAPTRARRAVTDPGPAPAARTAVTRGHAWSEQEDEELRDGVELGLPAVEIAANLEVPVEAVRARLAGLGLSAS